MPKFLKEYIRAYRHRKILGKIKVPENGTALDLSCSDGKFINRLHKVSPNLKLSGIDISNDDIKKAMIDFPFANFSTQNAKKLNFENNTFDIVFSLMSLHHYENTQEIFAEASRMLKTGGNFFLVDLIPRYKLIQKVWNRYRCPEPYHFGKYYSAEDLELILKPLNLYITEDKKITSVPRIRLVHIIKKP